MRPSAVLFVLALTAAQASFAADETQADSNAGAPTKDGNRAPIALQLRRAGSTNIDLSKLPLVVERKERPEREEPEIEPIELPSVLPHPPAGPIPAPRGPMPAPIASFDGLDFATFGAGHPPDTNGDVGPNHFIQTVNTAIGIYRKSDGVRLAGFTFNTFMSQGNFGNLCDTNNFGDPVVLYDTFEDRWIISDFAFSLDASSNVINPPGNFECIAVSKTGDPVSGGWNFYSINTTGGLGDYPKLGVWPDGIYMSVNMFAYAAGGSFQGVRVFAFNKAQMYAGVANAQVVQFNAPTSEFTLIPGNARLQAGTPPPGRPNYFVSTSAFLNALSIYKFHVDWNRTSLSTFTGPDLPLAATSWPNATVPQAPSLGGNSLDTLGTRAMVQNQYTNIGGVESLWLTHTVRRGDTTGFAAPRWYQVDVTGGAVAASLPQAATWDPDAANVIYRFIPSLAVDRAGNMALGYSTSNSTSKPAIKYAGRFASDPVNTLGQSEQVLIQGTGTQTGNCGGSACTRWGDYAAMSLDPDGCTFWLTSMYYAVDGLNDLTRIGSFKFPAPTCTPLGGGGTVSGTVTATVGGAPLSGATVTLGSRTATTNGAGVYSFSGIPAGTYASVAASAPGYVSSSASNVVVTDAATTTNNFSLGTAVVNACPVDTTQADFQTGTLTSVDVLASPDNVLLLNAATIDQSNTAGTTTGTSFSTTSWGGQTFIPAVTGQLTQADVQLFCSGCTGTTPNLTLSVRATSGGLPTGSDLASATLTGFSSGAGTYYSIFFASPATLTSGTQYALILRPAANPSVGGYFWIRSSPSTYANGQRVISTDNGLTFTADSTRDFNFKAYMKTGFAASGNLQSSARDSNPGAGFSPTWTTLSWTATTPANTALRFQVAASNSQFGPFNFVGPDGTAATFFTTSGASLTQFNGFRYLQYKALLSTTDSTATPTLADVTTCYSVLGPPELSITVSDGGASVVPGGVVSYTVNYANAAGNQDATGVTISDTVPANTTFNPGASTAGWSCTPNNNAGSTCTVAVGSLASGGSGSETFTVNLSAAPPGGVTQVSNTASITDDGSHGVDPTPGNNSATDTTPITPVADLSITKSDSPDPVNAGSNITWSITVANAGPSAATAASWSDALPASTSFVSLVSAAGWSCTTPAMGANGTISCSNASFAAGNASFTLVAKVAPATAPGSTVSNTATVTSSTSDPVPGNNSATATTTVTGVPTISAPGSVSFAEDSASASQSITVGDAETPASQLVLAAASSDQSLITDAALASGLGGSGASRTLVITPVANAFGSLTVTLTVTDASNASTSTPIAVTILPVNDAPSATLGPNRLHAAGTSGAQTVPGFATAISAGPANESAQTVDFLVTVPYDPTGVLSGAAIDPSGTLTYTLTGAAGAATIEVVVHDNGGTANGGNDRSPPVDRKVIVGNGVDLTTRIVRTQPPNLPLTDPSNAGATLAGYSVSVTNNGSAGVAGVTLAVPAPLGLTGVLWNCTVPLGACVPANGSALVNTSFDLAVGATATVPLSGTIDAAAQWVDIIARATLPASATAFSTGDDSAELIEPVGFDGMFKDGFE